MLSLPLSAQNEFYLKAYGGYAGIRMENPLVKPAFGYGGGIGAGYHLFMTRNFYVDFGLELSENVCHLLMPLFNDSYRTIDSEDEAFIFRYRVEGYRERIHYNTVTVPISFNLLLGEKQRFYVSAGGRFRLPFESRFRSSSRVMVAEGDYTVAHGDILDGPLFAGFGTFDYLKGRGPLPLKTMFFGNVDIGFRHRFVRLNSYLYVGLYVDFGINENWKMSEKKHFIEYPSDIPVEYLHSSVLTVGGVIDAANMDKHSLDSESANDFGDAIPFGIGISAKFTFGAKGTCNKSRNKPADACHYGPLKVKGRR